MRVSWVGGEYFLQRFPTSCLGSHPVLRIYRVVCVASEPWCLSSMWSLWALMTLCTRWVTKLRPEACFCARQLRTVLHF